MKLSLLFNLVFSWKSEIITNLHNRLVEILNSKLSRGDLLKIEKSQLNSMMYINLERERVEITYCQGGYSKRIKEISDIDRIDDDLLMDIYDFALFINRPVFYVYCGDVSVNLLSNITFREDFISRLNIISVEKSGPVFHFGYCVKDYKTFKEVLNQGSNYIDIPRSTGSEYHKYIVKLTTNGNIFYVFSFNYDMFDQVSISKRYLQSLYSENLDPLWDFLSNFNLELLTRTEELILYGSWSEDVYNACKDLSYKKFYDNSKSVRELENIIKSLFLDIKNFMKNKNLSEKDKKKLIYDKIWRREYFDLFVKLNGNEKEDIELILLTIYSLSKKPLFKILIRRLLETDLNPSKVLFLDLLMKLEVCDLTTINWFLFETPMVNENDKLSFHNEKIEYVENRWYTLRNTLYDFYVKKVVDSLSECLNSINPYHVEDNRLKAKISMLIYMKLVEYWERRDKDQSLIFKLYSDFEKNKDKLFDIFEIKNINESGIKGKVDEKLIRNENIKILPSSLILKEVVKKLLEWKIGAFRYEKFTNDVIKRLCEIFSGLKEGDYNIKEQLSRVFGAKLKDFELLDGKIEVLEKIPVDEP